MTKLLAVETSAEACSVALYYNGETRTFFEHAPRRHAELLLPAIRGLLEQAGMQLANLDAIAFGRGPGSFTSLRIGIGVVQGLAWGAGLPVVPVSSLAAIAQDAIERSASNVPLVCVAVDARMNEVYTATFRRNSGGIVENSDEERVCAAEQVVIPDTDPFIAAGNGFRNFTDLERKAGQAVECYADFQPRAERVGKLALNWLESNQPLPAGLAQPVYVRNNVASKPSR